MQATSLVDAARAPGRPRELLYAQPAEPRWYVHMMAVRPDLQGRGLGSALLRDVLDRARREAERPIVLTTHLPENVVFYGRQGFEVCAEQEQRPPDDRPYKVWSMRRER